MSDAGTVRLAVRRVLNRPAILAAALATTGLEVAVALSVAVLLPIAGEPGPALGSVGSDLVRTFGIFLATAFVVPIARSAALVACYGDRSPEWRALLVVSRRDGPRLVAATVVHRVVILILLVPIAAVVFGGGLAAATGIDLVRYTVDPTAFGGPRFEVLALGAGTLAFLATSFVLVAVAFFDALVVFDEAAPARAWLGSVGYVVRRPRRTIRYAIVRGALAVPAMLVALGVHETARLVARPAVFAGSLLAVIALLGTVRTLPIAYHVAFFERRVEGTPTPQRLCGVVPTRSTAVRVALVATVVLSLGIGSAAVRTADIRPLDQPGPYPVAEGTGAGTIVDHSNRQLAGGSYRLVEWTTESNYSTGANESTAVWRRVVDRRRKAVRTDVRSYFPNGSNTGDGFSVYHAEDAFGQAFVDETGRIEPGGWQYVPLPMWSQYGGGTRGRYSTAGADWQVRRGTETVRLAAASPEAVRAVTTVEYPRTATLDPNSSVRLFVDRETGRLERAVERVSYRMPTGSATESRRVVRTTVVDRYGEATVRRPPGLPGPSVFEWLLDVAYY